MFRTVSNTGYKVSKKDRQKILDLIGKIEAEGLRDYRDCLVEIISKDGTLKRFYDEEVEKRGEKAAVQWLLEVLGHYSKRCEIYKPWHS